MIIDIDNRQKTVAVDVEELAELYRTCLEALDLERGEISVVLVAKSEMARLNQKQMGVEGPTDVLSFPQLELDPANLEAALDRELDRLPDEAGLVLGDIVMCPEVILEQAPLDPWSQKEEELEPTTALVGRCPEPPGPESQFHLVAVHGLLHLLGHDHATVPQAQAMADAQAPLLDAVFGYSVLGEGEDVDSEDVDSEDGEDDETDEDDSDEDDEFEDDEFEDDEGDEDEAQERGDAIQVGDQPPGFRTGYVALIGRPNVGKSTLMNALVGAKVSITSRKPQTTRNRIVGIQTDERAQVLFLDTPGLHEAKDAFNRRLVTAALGSLEEADLICYMIDPPGELGPQERYALDIVSQVSKPKLLLINKVDSVAKESLLPIIARFQELGPWEEVIPISALDGSNLAPLMEAIIARLPEGPAQFPGDDLTDQTERFIVAETIREKILEMTRQEVPYATAVEVSRWEDSRGLLKVGAEIHVERQNQKGIVIGQGGAMLKRIGTAARKDLEKFFNCKIYLELHVTVSERWRESEAFLRSQNL